MTSIDVAAAARSAASAACGGAGRRGAARVTLRELRRLDEHQAAVALLAEIWGRPENPPIAPELLRAFGKSGGYIAGAFDAEHAGRGTRRASTPPPSCGRCTATSPGSSRRGRALHRLRA